MSEPKRYWHRELFEGRSALFAICTTIAVSIGGLVEIVPMFSIVPPPEVAAAVKPYTPLEVAGRDIYVREGCYVCHSQMVRPLRSETLRYGEWSRAAEYQWDRPFQLGSRRIGPDLHRVGKKYPDSWHYQHMQDPRAISPGSIMPAYPWLLTDSVDPEDIRASVVALKRVGTPYTEDDVANVPAAMDAQAEGIVQRLAEAKITTTKDKEIVALIAYLQRLGTDRQAVIAAMEDGDGGAK